MRKAIVPLLLLLPCLAHAAMYQCSDANGRRTYSDMPCSPDAKVIGVAPSPRGSSPAPSADLGSLGPARIEYYDVSGATLEQVRAKVRAADSDGWAGHTRTTVSYRLTTQPTSAGCGVDTVTVTLDAVVRLPRWVDRDAAPARAQGEWDHLLSWLVDHEQGHVRIGQSSADAVERAVRETPPGASCPDVAALAKSRANAVLALLPQQQEEYDARTNHGRGP